MRAPRCRRASGDRERRYEQDEQRHRREQQVRAEPAPACVRLVDASSREQVGEPTETRTTSSSVPAVEAEMPATSV